ncbi:MAG: ParA family protein [Clostridia bacterium]|nr:ParA family protein [Clostridia bacterium]
MITTYFCKKGGVGKTTVLGEHADYLAMTKNKKVLIVSLDDQNSVFEVFGKFDKVFETEDNYIENILAGSKDVESAIIPVRENIDCIKTLNTDMLAKKLTLERAFEKQFINLFRKLESMYDIVFIDLPPSNSRAAEVVFELCNCILLVVELTKLGVSGFYNTLQYFVDNDIDLQKIKYILPNGFAKNKNIPTVALDELEKIAKENLTNVKILNALPEKSSIQTLQHYGITIYDKKVSPLNSYARQQKKALAEIFTSLFDSIEL